MGFICRTLDLPLFSRQVMVFFQFVYLPIPFSNQNRYISLELSTFLLFVKGIRQYIFLLFHLEELLKLYVNLFYRFCVTLLFLDIFEQKKQVRIAYMWLAYRIGNYYSVIQLISFNINKLIARLQSRLFWLIFQPLNHNHNIATFLKTKQKILNNY